MMTTQQLRKGFAAWGSRWRLVETQRGRQGEARTMYVLERHDGHREARARESVQKVAQP
jgi:hypothetical protein